jgi:tRNA nucleotidyltransferase (CCA-adding enzyme)
MQNFQISSQLIHPLAVEVCKILHHHNYQAYIVGGCVRDLLLGQKPKDWDITSDAPPEKIMEIFPKNIPTGLQHGTVTVCMGEGIDNHFEVTTFRVEGAYSDGRRPDEVRFVLDVKEDLARRDLTINAMAYDPINDVICDPFGGERDLELGVIRAVGDANARFQEDGLRIMRAARFSARFGFGIHEHTFQGMLDNLETLKKVSKERVNDELSKTLMAPHRSSGLWYLKASGALDIACPLLAGRQLPLIVRQNECQGPLEVQLALLYNKLPLQQVQQELINNKFSGKEIKKTIFLLETVEKYCLMEASNTGTAYKIFMARLKNESPEPWQQMLKEFLQLSEPMEIKAAEMLDRYRDETVIPRKEMKITGDDLLAAGMKPGPQFKTALERCYTEILMESDHNTKEYLLELVRRIG